MSRHERRAVRAHPQHGFCNFLGPSKTADGMKIENKLVDSRLLVGTVGHRRLDHCRAYYVYADAASGIFERGGLCETNHAVLARAIRRCASQTYKPRYGRHVHDSSATALLEHLPDFVLEAQPNA